MTLLRASVLLAAFAPLCAMAAYPTAESSANTASASNQTTHTINYPATISANALLVMRCSFGAVSTTTFPTTGGASNIGWTVAAEFDAGGQALLTVGWMEAVGDEDGTTFNASTMNNSQSACRITSYTGTPDPDTTPPSWTFSEGTSTAPDPPSHAPSGWDATAIDTTYLAVSGADSAGGATNPHTGFPASYSNTGNIDSAVTSAPTSLGYADRQITNEPEDPGTFTLTNSDYWAAATIAVPGTAPAAGGGAVPILRQRGLR